MKLLLIILTAMLDMLPGGQAFLRPLTPRDSILIADQIEYGFRLDSVKAGTELALQDFSSVSNDTLTLVRNWQIDTVKKSRGGLLGIEGSIVLAPFEEGHYQLPQIAVRRMSEGGAVDTLLFDALSMDVKTMPVDTASFVIRDIKGQMRYPLTFREILPWAVAAWLAVALSVLTVCLVRMRRRSAADVAHSDDPAHIVALRRLDKFRSSAYWAPDRQKAYYSGITDALKDYIGERFGIDAPEMTTAELFAALKTDKDITPELYADTLGLFELADFVKFAKHIAGDEENASALPKAVRFVTSTYRTEPEEGQKQDVL